MKDFHCRDVGTACDFIARGDTEKEILEQVGRHAEDEHQLDVTPELELQVRGLIHDEASEAHRKSMTRS